MEPTARIPIVLPDLGTPRIAFSLWHIRVGSHVVAGDRVAEVLIPGATYDVAAPAAGRMVECSVRPRDLLAAGQVLGLIEVE